MLPGAFAAWGTPQLSGRDVTWEDGPSAVITASLARRFYAEQNPLARRIRTTIPKPMDYEIVGVVGDMAFNGPRLGHRDVMFVPCLQRTNPWPSDYVVNVFIRSSHRTLADLAVDVRRVTGRLGAHYVYSTNQQEEIMAYSVQQEQMLATVSGAFGGLIVMLTGVGLYAFCNYMLMFRKRELAIRAGLGASPTEIVATLMRETLGVLILGSIVGLATILLLHQVLAGFVVELGSVRWDELLKALVILALVVLVSSAVPVIRALQIDVARVLRLDD